MYDVIDLEGYKVKQIELRPELAKVGLEVRVTGNDTVKSSAFFLALLAAWSVNR